MLTKNLSYLSSFVILFSAEAALELEMTVAGLAMVKITSEPALPFSGPLIAGKTLKVELLLPHKFSLDLHLFCISTVLLLLLLLEVPFVVWFDTLLLSN